MKRTLALLVAALALIAAGCGSSSKSSSSSSSSTSTPASTSSTSTPTTSTKSGGGAATNLKLAADPSGQLKFDKSSLSAKAGNVTIVMSNTSPLPHGIAITGNGVSKTGSVVNKGSTSTVTASLKPGTYTFYCPVPGHRQAGMEGTLTVK